MSLNKYRILLFLSRAFFAAALWALFAAVLNLADGQAAQCEPVVEGQLQAYNPDNRCD